MKEIMIIREKPIQSLLTDIFTFGILGFMLYANYKWFGNHSIGVFMFIVMIIISILAKSNKGVKTFHNKEDAIKHINNL